MFEPIDEAEAGGETDLEQAAEDQPDPGHRHKAASISAIETGFRRVAIMQAATIIPAPISVIGRTGSAKTMRPRIEAQRKAVDSNSARGGTTHRAEPREGGPTKTKGRKE